MIISNEKKYSVIDCRVSDPQQLKGGSLDNQEVIGRLTSDKLGATVLRVFRKPHSATTTEREDFQEIIDFIIASKLKINYYIIKSLDRLTREGYPEYLRLKKELSKLKVQVVDTEGVIQSEKDTLSHLGNFEYNWNVYSPSEAGEMMETYKGKAEVRDILTRLIGAEIRYVQEGFTVRRPPDGLKNVKVFIGNRERFIKAPDENRSEYFRQMLTLRAKGLEDTEIVDRINAMGFRTRTFKLWDRSDKENPKVIGHKGGYQLTVKQLQRYIKQTEYAGIICEKWTNYQPVRMQQFNGLVPIQTFNDANRGKIFIKENPDGSLQVFRDYTKFGETKIRRLRNNPDYRYKFFPCPICHKPMLGSRSRGKSGIHYSAYHCGGFSNGVRANKYIRIPKEQYENIIGEYIKSFKFEQSFLDAFELVLNDVYLTREKEIVSQSSVISLSVGNLKAQQVSVLEALTNTQSPVARKMFEDKIDELQKQIDEAEIQRTEIEITEKDVKSFVKYVKTIMEHPSEILMGVDDMYVQRVLFGLVFENLPTYQEMLNGTPKLSLAFKLSEDYKKDKSQLVTLRGIEPRF